jgi:hypothetical protein
MRLREVLLTAPLAIALSGCWFGKKPVVAALPLPPQPVAMNPVFPPFPQAGEDEEEELPAIQPAPVPDATRLAPPPETEPVPPPKRPARPKKPSPATPETPVPANTQPVTPPARLEEVLTEDRRRQLETDFSKSVAQARTTLNKTNGRSLTDVQRQTAERIKTFLQQADQAKKGDLATAVQLARRAELLAQDLRKSLQ